MKKATLVVLLMMGIATTLLMAQNAPRRPDPARMVQHRVEFLSDELNLTDAQKAQATTIFTSAEQNAGANMDAMRAAHDALQTAVKTNNSAGIDQAAATIGSLTAQLTSAHAKADAAFVQILTADQQAKFSQMKFRGPGFMMMHGGPGPRHPEGSQE